MKKIFSLLLLSTLLFAFASCGGGSATDKTEQAASDKLLLRLRLKKGDSRPISMTLTSNVMGMETKMTMKAEMKVNDVAANGDLAVETIYNRVTMSIKGLGQNMSFDSDDKNMKLDDPMGMAFVGLNSLVGKPVAMTMNDKGKVVVAPDMNVLIPDSLKAMMGDQANGSQANQMFDNMFAIFPDEEITVGHTWEREMEMNTDKGPMKVKMKYTFEKMDGETVVLNCDGTMNGEMASATGMVKMSGTMKGSMQINKNTGWTENSEITQDLKMDMMGMKVTVSNKIVIESK